MLYWSKEKVVFVHIQKTGGSSISKLLRSALGTPEELGFKHDFSRWHQSETPEWDECFSFAFVRNPWDRRVSWYSMIDQNKELLLQTRNKLWEYVISESDSFDSFVRNCVKEIEDFDGKKSFIYNQLDYLTDSNGDLLVDFIGKYESFEDDMKHVLSNLRPDYQINFIHENQSRHRHYSSYYNGALKDIVAERYAHDIEYFGYKFEMEPSGVQDD